MKPKTKNKRMIYLFVRSEGGAANWPPPDPAMGMAFPKNSR